MSRKQHIFCLDCLAECAVREEGETGTAESLALSEHEAFTSMRESLRDNDFALSKPQWRWVERVCARLEINTTPTDERPPVPRGAPVELHPLLQPHALPKSPPRKVTS